MTPRCGGFSFLTMKKSIYSSAPAEPVKIPYLPVLWVIHSPDGSIRCTLAMLRLLNAHLFNN